ncbi:MFS transporter [Fulvitalea axinellae]|uniref:MFS transporter n=1 Tax=Fulvitalea axinellae TaxID=1182444 RepID=A0AAU9C745_9BACT|nr:MFS transporter [Fulvitalea axinellae]
MKHLLSHYGRLVIRYPRIIGFGASHYLASSFGQSFLISLFVPYLLSSFSLDNQTFSYYYSAATLGGAFLLSVFGPFTDKMPIRSFSRINGLALGGFCLVLASAGNPWVMLIALTGLRLSGQGLMPLAGATAMGKFFHHNRGKALALASMGMSIGEIFAPAMIIASIALWGWQETWVIFAVLAGIAFPALCTFLIKPDEHIHATGKKSTRVGSGKLSRKALLKDFTFLAPALTVVFSPFVTTGVFIHQNLILEAKGWEEGWFAATFIFFGTFRIISTLFTGPLIDKFTAVRLAPLAPIPLAIGIAVLFSGNDSWRLAVYLSLNGMSLSFGSLVGSALWAEIYGAQYLGTTKSLVSTIMVLATAVSPVIFGVVFQNYYDMQKGFIGILLTACTLSFLTFMALRSKRFRFA